MIQIIAYLDIDTDSEANAFDIANEILRPNLEEHMGPESALVDYRLRESASNINGMYQDRNKPEPA